MLDIFSKSLAKIFGTKSDRDIKEIMPYVNQTLVEYEKLKVLTDDQLRTSSSKVRDRIKNHLLSIDEQVVSLRSNLEANPEMDSYKKEEIFSQIDKFEKERDTELEKVLLEVLPEAFAIVKETARRYKENGKLEVTATAFDLAIANKKSNVVVENGVATWNGTWKVMGNDLKWEMVHYDVQLIGGVALHQGKISEMATGEGKTLVSTLPCFLNALAGKGVHLVTVNDYLAKRDSEWNAPLFEFHELVVDCIDRHEPNSPQRRQAYLADITYGTNNEFGFDYLRDNMARNTDELVQRKHHFAIVDEVDSVLIDDARTPLIISGPVPKGDEHMFYELKPRVVKLIDEQKKLIINYLNEAKKKLELNPKDEEAGLALFRAYRGLPQNKPLIKFLSETGNKAILQKTENFYLQDNQKEMPKADAPLFFTIDEKHNSIELTDKGIDMLTGESTDPQFFVLPDISTGLAKIENDKSLSDHERLTHTDHLINEYTIKTERIHTVTQLLKAYSLFEKEVDYIIVDNKVKIVDEQTGRVMEGRRYSDGLHQALEAKENVKVEDASQTYATVTLQNYFRMYHKLAGMTGTAETEAGEFWEIYKLDVVVIPTNLPTSRVDRQDKVYKTVREKFNAVVDEIVALTQESRPVLVGTTSVEISEVLSRLLAMRKIKHQVLNAKYHQKEAEIIAEAGKPGTVTIATNMAGRGTDIKLAAESKVAGGLAIIGTERHESRRVDRQLRGRAGRQGDPGSSQFFVSLEDNLMRLFGSDTIIRIMDRMGLEEGEVIQHSMITKSIERAQKKVEENNFGIRKRLLEYDDVMNSQREVVYKRRRNALFGERLSIDVINMIYDTCEGIISAFSLNKNYDEFRLEVIAKLGFNTNIDEKEFLNSKVETNVDTLYQETLKHYSLKKKHLASEAISIFQNINNIKGGQIENVIVPFEDGKRQIGIVAPLKRTLETNGFEFVTSLEKFTTLSLIDVEWREHLREMDDLKQSVQNAVYEQKDPLLIYKMEAYKLFKGLMIRVDNDITSFLMKADVPQQNNDITIEAKQTQRPKLNYKESKEDSGSILNGGGTHQNAPEPEQVKQSPIISQKLAGRNDRVTVQYLDGSIKADVKFKSIEEDLKNNRCILIDVA